MRVRHARGTVCIASQRDASRVVELGASRIPSGVDAAPPITAPAIDSELIQPPARLRRESRQIMRVSSLLTTAALLVVTMPASTAVSELIDRFAVGAGDQTASLQFDFLDGRTWVFDVSWSGDLSGRSAFDLIASDNTGRFAFDFEVISYSFGDFLVGVSVEDAYHHGTGTPPDYADTWHFWSADAPEQPWTESLVGFNDRVLTHGARDGWVFGTTAPPATIPAPGGLALAMAAIRLRDRRRR